LKIEDNMVMLVGKRAELIDVLAGTLPPEVRICLQGELSVINAQIKALNTTKAAQLKAEADRRKIAGLTEAQANAARARARLNGGEIQHEVDDDAPDDDPAQTEAIVSWIVAVLQRGGLKVHRASDGNLDLIDTPAKWVGIIEALCAGIHAAARGQELPEITTAPKTRKR
jgi:hypothetical protein